MPCQDKKAFRRVVVDTSKLKPLAFKEWRWSFEMDKWNMSGAGKVVGMKSSMDCVSGMY